MSVIRLIPFEVPVRIKMILPVAGLAACSWTCLAQTMPVVPVATSSSTPLPSMPVPVADQQGNQSVPAATSGGAPVVAPAPATAARPVQAAPPYQPYGIPDEKRSKEQDLGSAYIPVDSWVYPAMTRLYALGYANKMYLAMRPYTRQSLAHILEQTHDQVADGDSDEAKEILASVERFVRDESLDGVTARGAVYGTETVYTRLLGIQGQSLNDSYHLGQTIVNDYGRPYQPGFNAVAGFSSLAEKGRFSFYFRGEYEHAPSAIGYSPTLSAALSQGANPTNPRQYTQGDEIPFSGFNLHQRTIPTGPIGAENPFRVLEATLSFHILGHEISGGKSDSWQGPLQGGAMSWSNNAQNIYSFRINRVEPLYIPFFSYLFGTVRYDFFYGDLKGHSYPNSPYIHSEQVELRPTDNFEFGFQRSVIFGGEGHVPVTLHTFLRSFFSVKDTEGEGNAKNSSADPGDRLSDFSFSYRLPFVRKYVTLLADTFCHDDVTPISAPRRAAYRTGLVLPANPWE